MTEQAQRKRWLSMDDMAAHFATVRERTAALWKDQTWRTLGYVKSRVFWRPNVRSVIRPPKSAGSCSGLLRSRRESDSQASNATVRC